MRRCEGKRAVNYRFLVESGGWPSRRLAGLKTCDAQTRQNCDPMPISHYFLLNVLLATDILDQSKIIIEPAPMESIAAIANIYI
jgi:hypothetical protein